MIRILVTAAIAVWLVQPPTAGDLVELDVAVVDRGGSTVTGLTAADFQIKEDGKAVDVTTFSAVTADGSSEESARQIVVLLDDTLPAGGTAVVQQMAQLVVSRARPYDEVTVVRLHNDRDEAFGDLQTALDRIDGYRAATIPFDRRSVAERALAVLSTIARQVGIAEHRRKALVCIGTSVICNTFEPPAGAPSRFWKLWTNAMAALSRANVAIYAVIPVHPGALLTTSHGSAELTGGTVFANTAAFEPFVNSVWREASQYYLIGYWPRAKRRDLHDISVSVRRKGLRVRTRLQRG